MDLDREREGERERDMDLGVPREMDLLLPGPSSSMGHLSGSPLYRPG